MALLMGTTCKVKALKVGTFLLFGLFQRKKNISGDISIIAWSCE